MTTNPPTYIPRSGSLPDRVLDYFRQCPDEELSQADVAAKFDVSRGSVGTCLKPTVEAGLLVYARNDDLEHVYTIPGKKAQARLAATAAPGDALDRGADLGKAPATPVVKPAARVRLPVSALDFSAIAVETGVPLAGSGVGGAGESKWAPLFAKLAKPDTSLEIPAEWKSAVAAHATKLNAQHKKAGQPTSYLVRHTDPGKARIWRTA